MRRERLTSMFVVELLYKASLPAIDANMSDHVRFLNTYYASGHFLVSGRKVPRDGGIIIAVANSREEIEAIVRNDPFCVLGSPTSGSWNFAQARPRTTYRNQ